MFDNQGRERSENIEQRHREQALGGRLLDVIALAPGGEGFQDHPEAHAGGDCDVQHAAQADKGRHTPSGASSSV